MKTFSTSEASFVRVSKRYKCHFVQEQRTVQSPHEGVPGESWEQTETVRVGHGGRPRTPARATQTCDLPPSALWDGPAGVGWRGSGSSVPPAGPQTREHPETSRVSLQQEKQGLRVAAPRTACQVLPTCLRHLLSPADPVDRAARERRQDQSPEGTSWGHAPVQSLPPV